MQAALLGQAAPVQMRLSIQLEVRTANGSKRLSTVEVIGANGETFSKLFSSELFSKVKLYGYHTGSRQ
jgi:hypothetical protein